jgi:hypothetical protein
MTDDDVGRAIKAYMNNAQCHDASTPHDFMFSCERCIVKLGRFVKELLL